VSALRRTPPPRLQQGHSCLLWSLGLDRCEVNAMIALNPAELWMGTVISVELDNTIEQTTQVALTSLCESDLATTAAMLIALFLIHN
jgi:hypothetical protein